MRGRIERVLSQIALAAPPPSGALLPAATTVIRKRPDRITPGQGCVLEIRLTAPLPLLAAASGVLPFAAFALRVPPSAQAHVIQTTPPLALGVVTELL